MKSGSLTIGGINDDYGWNTNAWTNTNVAGLLLECSNDTEIAVHDSLNRVVSQMAYKGNTTKEIQGNTSITIGRDMGQGAIGSVVINGNIIGSGTTT